MWFKQASTFFSKEEQQQIAAAVGEAEARTSAEIVPVVVSASGRYDRAEDICGLWTALIFLGFAYFLVPQARPEPGTWDFAWSTWELPIYLLAVLLGFLVGTVKANYVAPLRQLFTPRVQMREEVEGRARQLFVDQRIHHTQGATGLLIYLSLYEHMASVIADATVTEKLGQEALDALCEELTAGLRSGKPAEALCQTIRGAGARLSAVLPREGGTVNELPDALVMLD